MIAVIYRKIFERKARLSTKAETLESLSKILRKSKIEKLYYFTFLEWKNNKDKILSDIKDGFGGQKIVVRSSSIHEDNIECSMAGCFESVLNIDSSNLNEIENAIKKVVFSYKKKNAETSLNQILVQSQAKDITLSGVLFTRVPETNAPYYVINYDVNGSTDSVTSGIENKSIKISRFVDNRFIDEKFRKIITSVKEIENLFKGAALDIEFGVNSSGEVIIFQARPLVVKTSKISDSEIKKRVGVLQKRFEEVSGKNHLFGEKSILADMPDWNPAEIIGNNPHYLDFSLYGHIITNKAWHIARTSQGYRNVSPTRLVRLIGNKPYIDVRGSFNSFIPASLNENIAKKLVSFYLNKLNKNPEMQDKVEFEIVYTCYDLMFNKRKKELLDFGFSENEVLELKKSLINLTNNLVKNSKEAIKNDLGSLEEMKKNRTKITLNPSEDFALPALKCAKILLDDCREKGTIQFSRLARLGFIGKIILKSLVKEGVVSSEFYDRFMGSINTVASDFKKDFQKVSKEQMSLKEFTNKYYHLRPGTYDITHLRYGADASFLKPSNISLSENKANKFKLDKGSKMKINKILKEEGLEFDVNDLFNFIKKSLEARELSKFEFSKNLSDAIELIAIAGESMGFSRQEIAMLGVEELFPKIAKNKGELIEIWRNKISMRKKQREVDEKVELPPIIFSKEDFDFVKYYSPRPNYITRKSIKAKLINPDKVPKEYIKGKIAMIESGDPGYDWIFTRGIAGLITKYGGVASHMAIRCAEFGIPAAIGCGSLYDQIKEGEEINLDCNLNKITKKTW